MNLKRSLFPAIVSVLTLSIFLFSGCALPGAEQSGPASLFTPGPLPTGLVYQNGTAASRTTSSFFTHKSWTVGQQVFTPVFRWYFNSTTTTPSGYHYLLKFWYYYDNESPSLQDGIALLGTITSRNLATASYTFAFPDTTPRQYVMGVVQAWMVRESDAAAAYLGYAQETEWSLIHIYSD